MTKPPFIDLHTHSSLSDGLDSPRRLISRAYDAGIRVLAITDHNTTTPDFEALCNEFPKMHLIPGCEISCIYHSDSIQKELHVIALGIDPNNPILSSVLARNRQFERSIYINMILNRLHSCGIHIGSYAELKALYPDSQHIGRKHIATEMFKHGYVSSIDEAFDRYIGAFGERLAYVKNPAVYITLEEAVHAILAAGGIAILAHLLYYDLNDTENRKLLQRFKLLTGDRGGMETIYVRYSSSEQNYLSQLAEEFDLFPSAASDFHATEDHTLEHHLPYEIYETIKQRFHI